MRNKYTEKMSLLTQAQKGEGNIKIVPKQLTFNFYGNGMIHENSNNEKNLSQEKYAEASEQKAKEIKEGTKKFLSPEERVVEEYNEFLAIIHTKSTYVLYEKSPTEFVLDSTKSIKTFFSTDLVEIDGQKRSKFGIWVNSSKRRTFKDIVFDPRRKGHYDGKYNLWRGFAYEAKEGNCGLFLDHMRDNICKGNEKHFEYLLKWCAHLIQKPWEIGTALVLRGQQGVGKGVFVHTLGELFGIHYLQLANLEQVLGRFNSHLQNGILIFADEAIWGGNKKELGVLKAMITERRQFIEAKGKDGYWIDNFKHLIVSSNEDYAVHLDPDDRRFFVLNVSSKYKEDIAYFKAIQDQLDSGGYEALMYKFMNLDLTGFDPRHMVENYAGFDMKMMSASSIDRYIYAALKEGCWDIGVSQPSMAFKIEILTDELYRQYNHWCTWENEKLLGSSQFGARLKKIFPIIEKHRSPRSMEKRPSYYVLPDFETCRKNFETFYKQDQSIWEMP